MELFQPADSVEQGLTVELARRVISANSPDELIVFEESVSDFLRDPQGTLGSRNKDEPLGFGVELTLLTPIVLSMTGIVVKALGDLLADSLKERTRPFLASLFRRLQAKKSHTQERELVAELSYSSLPPEHWEKLHRIALQEAKRLDLTDAQGALLADSILGALLAPD